LGGRKGIWPVKTEWWGAGVVICLERDADLHMAPLMPLPLTASCFRKIQIGFTFLVPAHPGSPGKRAVKRVCVCVFVFSALTPLTGHQAEHLAHKKMYDGLVISLKIGANDLFVVQLMSVILCLIKIQHS